MARLPLPGSDQGTWGDILNDYLSQAHKTDGSLKDDSVTATTIAAGVITETKLAPAVQTKLNSVTGPQGATGPQGPSGVTGAQGATGVSGTQGASGTPGTQGATGAQGVAGSQGMTGATGPAGQDGTSVTISGSVANAAALPTGLGLGDAGDGYLTDNDGHLHVWSGSSWTDVGEIRGPQGATGPQGVAGSAGVTGATGSAGATGAQGNAGAAGAAGPAGPSGATGAQGPTGVTGATGPAGATTIAGISGLQTALDAKASLSHTHSATDVTSGTLTLARQAPGTEFAIFWNGTAWTYNGSTITVRPANATHLRMIATDWLGTSGSAPSFMQAGDAYDVLTEA